VLAARRIGPDGARFHVDGAIKSRAYTIPFGLGQHLLGRLTDSKILDFNLFFNFLVDHVPSFVERFSVGYMIHGLCNLVIWGATSGTHTRFEIKWRRALVEEASFHLFFPY
jgi:hypothetical protein